MTAIKTPCLLIWKKDNNIRALPDNRYLYRCFSNEIENYTESIIIDSDQNIFIIKNAEKVGWGSWFFGMNLLYKHRILKIKFNVSNIRKAALGEIKTIIIDKVEDKPTGRFMLDYFGSVENLKARVNTANTMETLIRVFIEDE